MHKKKGRKGYVMFKIDFEKAYDSVDWNFQKITLNNFGFPLKIINIMMSCATSTSLSLKWKGEKLYSFATKHGLRQGDSTSHYLFVLCMEILLIPIQQKVKGHSWFPIKINDNG